MRGSVAKRGAYLAMTIFAVCILLYAASYGNESGTDRFWSIGLSGFLIRDIFVHVDALLSQMLADAKANLTRAQAFRGALVDPSTMEN